MTTPHLLLQAPHIYLVNGPFAGSATFVPTPSGDVWHSTGSSLCVYKHGNHGSRNSCWLFYSQLSFHTNFSSAPSRPEHFRSDSARLSLKRIVLTRCGLPRSLCGLDWQESSTRSMPPEDAFDGSTSQTHEANNATLPHAVTGKCKHFKPNTYRGWTGHY